jgi:5'-3' exonuclease
MGIKDLAKYIRDNTTCYKEVHLSEFYAKSVAVDISVFLYKTIRSVGEENWISPMIILLKTLKKFGIKVVCIFDGLNVPPEKMKERAERKKSSNKVKEKASEVYALIDEVNKFAPVGIEGETTEEIPRELRNRIRDVCIRQRNGAELFEDVDYRDYYSCIRALTISEKKFEKQCIPITKEHSEIVKDLSTKLGFAVFQADGEAELLCAYMCKHRMVDAVLTEDTDVLVYKTPIFLSKIDTAKETCMKITYDDLVSQIGLTSEQFTDFAIMLGCDYNSRIKLPSKNGKKQTGIGPVKAYNLLTEHGSIENIEYHTNYDTSPLIYQRCRFLFDLKNYAFYQKLAIPYNKPLDKKGLLEILRKYNCLYFMKQLEELWKPTEVVFIE